VDITNGTATTNFFATFATAAAGSALTAHNSSAHNVTFNDVSDTVLNPGDSGIFIYGGGDWRFIYKGQ